MAVSLNTRAQLLLAQKVVKMSATMQDAAEKGNLEYSDAIYYKRYAIPVGGSGMLNILKNDDSELDGFCNISKQKISQNCAFMADRITVRIGWINSSDESYATANETSVAYLPVASLTGANVLRNAELEVQFNNVKINQSPLDAYNMERTSSNGDKDGLNLSAPKFISDEQQMQFRLHIPDGQSIPSTAKYFIEVAVHGAEVRVK